MANHFYYVVFAEGCIAGIYASRTEADAEIRWYRQQDCGASRSRAFTSHREAEDFADRWTRRFAARPSV